MTDDRNPQQGNYKQPAGKRTDDAASRHSSGDDSGECGDDRCANGQVEGQDASDDIEAEKSERYNAEAIDDGEPREGALALRQEATSRTPSTPPPPAQGDSWTKHEPHDD